MITCSKNCAKTIMVLYQKDKYNMIKDILKSEAFASGGGTHDEELIKELKVKLNFASTPAKIKKLIKELLNLLEG